MQSKSPSHCAIALAQKCNYFYLEFFQKIIVILENMNNKKGAYLGFPNLGVVYFTTLDIDLENSAISTSIETLLLEQKE